jgi:branched-chain amino acid transport system permease protein
MTLSRTSDSATPAVPSGRSDSHGGTGQGGFAPPRLIAGAALFVVAVAVPFVLPGLTGLLVIAAIFFLVALGLILLMGHAGQVSLGQTLFMAIGGYGAGALTLSLHWPTTVAAIAMAVLSGVVAFALGGLFLRLRGYYFALATLGLAVATQSLASAWAGLTGGPSGMVAIPSLQLGGYTVFSDRSNYFVLLVVGILAAAFIANVQRSQTGRVLTAIGNDPGASAMLGINTARYKTMAFVVSAVLASLGGSMYAFYLRFMSPDVLGVTVALSIVIMIALGGARTLVGPLLGALVIQGLPIAGQSFALWEPLAAGILLILVMTYLPRGIWGTLTAYARKTAAQRRGVR